MSESTADPAHAFEAIQAVLFDLDGTLVDSAPDLAAAANKMRTDRGLPLLPLEKYRSSVGSGARGMISVGFDLTPQSDDFNDLKNEFFANYQAGLTNQTELFAGVEALIGAIVRAGLKWGVVTNKPGRFTVPLTRALPLFASASAIVSGDTTPHAKPHPAPLLLAAQQLGILVDNCVYVGDDERDIVAGKAAGMKTVVAAYGYLGQDIDHRLWTADATINTPLDLLELLNLPGLA